MIVRCGQAVSIYMVSIYICMCKHWRCDSNNPELRAAIAASTTTAVVSTWRLSFHTGPYSISRKRIFTFLPQSKCWKQAFLRSWGVSPYQCNTRGEYLLTPVSLPWMVFPKSENRMSLICYADTSNIRIRKAVLMIFAISLRGVGKLGFCASRKVRGGKSSISSPVG